VAYERQRWLPIRYKSIELHPGYARQDDFWATQARIGDIDAPSADELAEAKRHVWCGEPEWAPLSDAIAAACTDPKEAPTRNREAFCSDKRPSALLYQVMHCTDGPGDDTCHASTFRPSVSRVEVDAGHATYGYHHSSVTLERRPDRWHVLEFFLEED
jgi:hypothetical protein